MACVFKHRDCIRLIRIIVSTPHRDGRDGRFLRLESMESEAQRSLLFIHLGSDQGRDLPVCRRSPLRLASVPAMLLALLGALGALAAPRERSLMMWLTDKTVPPYKEPDSAAVWAARLANIGAHRENLTTVSPCIHGITSSGGFGNQGQSSFANIAPHLPVLVSFGLDIVPIIYNVGGLGGMAAAIKGSDKFIAAAVAAATKGNYSGYNIDNELRGGSSEESWKQFDAWAKPWMAFMDKFADALREAHTTLPVHPGQPPTHPLL